MPVRGGSNVCMLTHVWLFETPCAVPCQAPLSMGFSRQEYWNGLPFPSPWDLLNPGIEPMSPALQADSLPLSHLGSELGASARWVTPPSMPTARHWEETEVPTQKHRYTLSLFKINTPSYSYTYASTSSKGPVSKMFVISVWWNHGSLFISISNISIDRLCPLDFFKTVFF